MVAGKNGKIKRRIILLKAKKYTSEKAGLVTEEIF